MQLGSYNWKVMFNWLSSKQLRKEQDQLEKKKKRISDWNQEYRLRINLRQYGTACLGRIFQYTKLKDTTQYSN